MIQHVTRQIAPADLPACIDFYALLGLAPVTPPPSIGDRAVWLAPTTGPSVQLHLLAAADARPEQGHVAIVVSDYDGVVARLRAAGYAVEPRREHWGAPRAYVRDPASNVVELMAAAPGEWPQ
jgi:catechol 2,3-dioxygenase-like lactoylglutathione lyase family enzyme